MNGLPYENARSGASALSDIQTVLRRFGCSKFGHWEDYDGGTMTVQFEWSGKTIQLTASAKGYAAAWLKQNPWSSRRRSTREMWEQRALQKGQVAVYSILRDWVKAQVTAVETGLLSFEGVFLPHMLLTDGKTVLEHADRLQPLLEHKHH